MGVKRDGAAKELLLTIKKKLERSSGFVWDGLFQARGFVFAVISAKNILTINLIILLLTKHLTIVSMIWPHVIVTNKSI